MRIFNRAHVPWFLFCLIATAIAAWIYAGNFLPNQLPHSVALPSALTQAPAGNRNPGGTPVGLIFGTLALAFAGDDLSGLRSHGFFDTSSLPTGAIVALGISSAVASMLTTPIKAAVDSLLYVDQRMRRENLAVDLQAAAAARR